ncbi:p21-activated protein kinase-interacting protein 1-like [Condylostylus longicornis]|uniref:p21-activated protein kinase-interacting protein 1-like n=1 Tax=Condylostylus longicornis TaxID=2530218 RepID=UPI00244DEBD2|nr:p21-activated protein kinase-interacting protein 1-like [Condylostylus longicornis]
MIEDIEIIIGTYEEFLLGYKAKFKNDQYMLLPTFSSKSHTASVRAVAVSEKYLASGGADDKIFIFDMKQRKEVQILINHTGTINTLKFTPNSKQLLSGAEDGRMLAIRVGSWNIDGNWEKAHDGSAVKHISCHPSGKLVLSLGQDFVARTWNLLTGRCVFKTNLKSKEHLGKSPECIEWSPKGNYFLLSGLRVVELISIENKKTEKEIKLQSKPVCLCWITEESFAIGLENGKVILSTIHLKDKEIYTEVDEKRIKCISHCNNILATASSSGEIALWNISIDNLSLKKITSVNIGCRPTCMALLNLQHFKKDYLLTESEIAEVTPKNKETTASKATFRNLQHVAVEYEDNLELNNVKINSNQESSDTDENVGTFVRIKKENIQNKTRKGNEKIKNKNKKKLIKRHESGKISKRKNLKKIKKKKEIEYI